MPGLWSIARAIASTSAYDSWVVTVSHPGLGLTRTFSGRDKMLVEQRAHAQCVRWDQQWERRQIAADKRAQVEARRQEKEDALDEAGQRTEEAQEAVSAWRDLLAKGLERIPFVEWEIEVPRFEERQPKPNALPLAPAVPSILTPAGQTERRKALELSRWLTEVGGEPKPDDQEFRAPSGLGSLFNSKGHQQRIAAGQARFNAAHAAWAAKKKRLETAVEIQVHDEAERAKTQNEREQAQWRTKCAQVSAENEAAETGWASRKQEWDTKWTREAHDLLKLRKAYAAGQAEGVEKFLELAGAALNLPDFVPADLDHEYSENTRSVVVDFALPAPNVVPKIREVRYVHSRREFDELTLTEKVRNEIYDSGVYQIVLLVLHDLFAMDTEKVLAAITLNGVVESTSRATGKTTATCILSIQVTREQMENLVLTHIDAKTCFKSLKGVGSSQLFGLAPVPPIVSFNKTDRRFVPAQSVAAAMASGPNIATMDWEDFEHLVRELFEKEFSHNGAEVRITRASRDAGVDAVVFDPDPLRGGKIIIQAKRYSNTVELSAVRDLYGTVVNEGATKGILVTTSDYGPDAYSFAKDKPLTLLTGGNLLHLLKKHGYGARLDLKEAKAMLKDGGAWAGRFRK